MSHDDRDRRKSRAAKEEEASPGKSCDKRQQAQLILCTASCRYNVIKRACRQLDFKLSDDENADWDLYWSDVGVQMERISKLRPYQRINNIPGIHALS
jgi:hypothetical protein